MREKRERKTRKALRKEAYLKKNEPELLQLYISLKSIPLIPNSENKQ